jgi:predicted RNase H-like HicB family nuclease
MKTIINVAYAAEVKWDRDAEIFVAMAPELGIGSQGKDMRSALRALTDAVRGAVLVAFKEVI